jgi:DivIVA domain-containing protein
MAEQPIGADQVARKQFGTAFRGFDQYEVRAFLAQVAAELMSLQERERALRERLAMADESSRATRPAGDPLSDDELEAAVGAETTRVLHAAREAATEIRARAEESVARMLREANDESTRMRTEAESLLARLTEEAEVSASSILGSAEGIAAQLRADAEAAASATIEEAQTRGREMLGEAQAVRERVLKDLARKRRHASAQVEQLLAGRERLLTAYEVVRSTLDAATSELSVAEVEARLAAEAAGARMPAEDTGERPVVAEDGPATEPLAPTPTVEPGPGPKTAVRPVVVPEPEPEPEPEPGPTLAGLDDRRSSSLRLLRRRPEVPELPILEDDGESVRIIRPEPPAPEPVAPRPVVVPDPPAEPAVASEPEPEPLEPAQDAVPVDDLFARIRADRAAALAQAEVVLAAEPEAVAEPEPEPEHAVAAVEPEVDEAAPDEDAPPVGEAEARFERRDATLEPIERSLIRTLKRALADEQNEVLDSLRRLRGAPSLDALLPPEAEHVGRYERVALEHLEAGATDGASSLEGKPGDVGPLATSLGRVVSEDLRVRIGRALDSAGSDEEALVEAISATYREWKVARIEPFSRHHAAAAYAFGVFSGAPVDELVWVVDRAEGGCPDCDDNALAGPTARGSVFPTGQLHPPAHAGCRCLVVPGG